MDEDDLNDEEDLNQAQKPCQAMLVEYRHLIDICVGKSKGGLVECFKVDPDILSQLSLSEQNLAKGAITNRKVIVEYC